MIVIKGKYNAAQVMIDTIDDSTRQQIQEFVNHPTAQGIHIVIQADCHYGNGCVVGYTATLGDYIVPNLIGVDIACGVDAYEIGKVELDRPDVDRFIRERIPHGFSVRSSPHEMAGGIVAEDAVSVALELEMDTKRVLNSLGTLGGCNHFIELDRDPNTDSLWLVLHSGSRKLGHTIATYWQARARELLNRFFVQKDQHKGLEFLPVEYAGGYIEHVEIAKGYAALNREIMAHEIVEGYFGKSLLNANAFGSVHNYIDFDAGIVRKGAISAMPGEGVVIPLNMEDGTILGHGKSTEKYNFSAPHGAGRVLSRKQARLKLNVPDFKAQMDKAGVWSSCVNASTIDESPAAYKPSGAILEAISEVVDVQTVLKPVYVFKDSKED